MIIKNTHPEYATDQARMDKLRQMKRLCRQKLAVTKKGEKAS